MVNMVNDMNVDWFHWIHTCMNLNFDSCMIGKDYDYNDETLLNYLLLQENINTHNVSRQRVLMSNINSTTCANGNIKYKLWLQMIKNDKKNVYNGFSEHIIISLIISLVHLVERCNLMFNNGSE